MSVLLRKYIESIILEMQDIARVQNRSSNIKKFDENKEDEEIEEMSTVASSLGDGGGFTAPLGYTSKDVKRRPRRTKR